MKLKYLLIAIAFVSCNKEVIEPIPAVTVSKPEITNTTVSGNVTTISGIVTKQGIDPSSHGIIYYNNNIIISPAENLTPTKPFHLVKKNNSWAIESINPVSLMDHVRNVYKVSDGTYVWANASDESGVNIGSLYLSKTTSAGSIEWQKLSDSTGFYHYAGTGDIDNDGTPEIFSYVGAELESPEIFKMFKQNGSIYSKILPTTNEFEQAVGFIRRDDSHPEIFQPLNSFSFGAITLANIDATPDLELIITSTKADMSKYYSFIILKYDGSKFKIYKVIKPTNSLLEKYHLGVADVKTGDFNDDGKVDLVVTMGNNMTYDQNRVKQENSDCGVQVWFNDGNGNFIPSTDKSEIYSNTFGNMIYYTNLEVGKYQNRDCVFLHFDRTRYNGLNDNNKPLVSGGMLDMKNHFLINDGNKGSKFDHPKSLTLPGQIPTIVKGYFEENALRLVGFRDVTKEQFEVVDVIIK
jgi:hypothetical protein